MPMDESAMKSINNGAEPLWHGKSTLILGCGNWLCGDDGFGPAVAERLQAEIKLPDDVCVLDAGTSVREILFDVILSDQRPHKIVIIDAVDCQREPGELFLLDIEGLPHIKLDDFSMHQLPTSNLLRELRDLCGVEVVLLACQVQDMSDEVHAGLSEAVGSAVGRAADRLAQDCLRSLPSD
jgi:coenzyme F420 hydrogenase subunit delta